MDAKAFVRLGRLVRRISPARPLEADRVARLPDFTGQPTVLCESPTILKYKAFLTEQEARHLARLAGSRLRPSTVVDNKTGASVRSDYRSGRMAGLAPSQDEVIRKIEERVAQVTGTRACQGESIQVIAYAPGETYRPHCDWYDPRIQGHRVHLREGGQRVWTAVMCIKAAEEGGQTAFPAAGISLKLEPGEALLFCNVGADGQPDPRTIHTGCPVIRGEKIIATRWIRERAADGSEEKEIAIEPGSLQLEKWDATQLENWGASADLAWLELETGMDVVDVGCGAGSITRRVALMVAPGRVVGVDRSALQLDRASRLCRSEGITNVELVCADGGATRLPPAAFDVVFSHAVLMHLADPVAALRHHRELARVGGLVAALSEGDWGTLATHPHSDALARAVGVLLSLIKMSRGDPQVGRKVLGIFRRAGFEDVMVASASTGSKVASGKELLRGPAMGALVGMLKQGVAAGLIDAGDMEPLVASIHKWATDADAVLLFPQTVRAKARRS
jgi:prolyl 4-hydroxylase